MRRIVFAALLGLLAGPVGAQGGMRRDMTGYADPSAIVSATLSLNSEAAQRGRWEALRRAAAKDAIMFQPQPLNAQRWLRKRTAPAPPMRWRPEAVYMACDGSYGAGVGRWSDGHRFAMVWRRQEGGGYAWLILADVASPSSAESTDDIRGVVADCDAARTGIGGKTDAKPDEAMIANPPPADGEGQSRDGTLKWQWRTDGAGSGSFSVTMRRDGAWQTVVDLPLGVRP